MIQGKDRLMASTITYYRSFPLFQPSIALQVAVRPGTPGFLFPEGCTDLSQPNRARRVEERPIAAWGASENELMREYRQIRLASRDKKKAGE